MTGFFLQLVNERSIWEEVDQFTWENWDKAVDRDSKSRYTGNRVMKTSEDDIHITTVDNLRKKDLAIIARFCSVTDRDCPAAIPGGFVRTPELVRFKKRNKIILHGMDGEEYISKNKVTLQQSPVVGEAFATG